MKLMLMEKILKRRWTIQFFICSISRLGVKAKGPNVWGAKMTGTLRRRLFWKHRSFNWFIRLRHAYAKH
jgi:hypothetical protein